MAPLDSAPRESLLKGQILTSSNRAESHVQSPSPHCLEAGPFPLGKPEEYARQKSAAFPAEGGGAILSVDVPDEIIALAVTDYFPLSQGFVQFDEGAGLEQLRSAWPRLFKGIQLLP